jgi:DNA polymerase III delta prime subunit
MLRPINLFSLADIQDKEAEQTCFQLLGTKFKDCEMETLRSLCSKLRNKKVPVPCVNDFYVGFQIPQISKEFDLLRLGDSIVNIELKSQLNKDKALLQLQSNRHYLKFLGKKISLFTYCSKEKQLFTLDANDNLVETEFEKLIKELTSQKDIFSGDLAAKFNPANFLVSPFNSTEKFLRGEYFLTAQQDDITSNVLKEFSNKKFFIISINGEAGTGKSLLLYHIAQELMKKTPKVIIFHAGSLNKGQRELQKQGWKIRHYLSIQYDAVLIDEAQRITKKQLKNIMKYSKQYNALCIFFHDDQVLNPKEAIAEIADMKFKLTKKLRANKEIANFISAILGKRRNKIPLNNNINIVYFKNAREAKDYISAKTKTGEWVYIARKDTREVIGQEFDNVITEIGKTFCHSSFFQAATRARERLEVVVVKNIDVYKKMLFAIR